MKPMDMRRPSDIADSNHLSPGAFEKGSVAAFVAECPAHLPPLARLIGCLLAELNTTPPTTMPRGDIALLTNTSKSRVQQALRELYEAGYDIGCVK